jgi:hypothetical protein
VGNNVANGVVTNPKIAAEAADEAVIPRGVAVCGAPWARTPVTFRINVMAEPPPYKGAEMRCRDCQVEELAGDDRPVHPSVILVDAAKTGFVPHG